MMIVSIVAMAFFLVSCSSSNSNKQGNNSTKQVTQKNKPLSNVDTFNDKKYVSSGAYSSKKELNLKEVSWNKIPANYIFVFLKDNRAFIGKYVKGKLNYGHFYKVEKYKKGIFMFKEEKFVTAESNYSNQKDNMKTSYTKISGDQIPDAASGVQYYQTKDPKNLQRDVKYKFYSSKKTLVRELVKNKDIHSYMQFTLKK